MTFRPSNRSTAEANSISKKDRKPAAKGHSPKRAWISLASNASKNRTNSQVCKCAIRKPCTNLLSKHGHNSRAHMPAWNAGYLRCQGSPVAQGATPWTLSSSIAPPQNSFPVISGVIYPWQQLQHPNQRTARLDHSSPYRNDINLAPTVTIKSAQRRITPDDVLRSAIKKPMVAIMEMRPCFNSTDRRRLNVATSPSEVNPTGSQKPTGA